MAAPQTKDRPNSLWPVGTRLTLLDAWMRNPTDGKRVDVATDDKHIVMDDDRGVRHFAHTDRIVSPPLSARADGFDDLLGVAAFEDLF